MPKQPPVGSSNAILDRLPAIFLWVGGFVFGRWAGLSFIIPFICSAAGYFALKKVLRTERETAIQLVAVQFGHWCWLCLGLTAPGGVAQVGGDVVILAVLLLWFGLTTKRAPAYCLLAFQVISCAVNLSLVPAALGTPSLAAVSVHLVFRLAAIALIISFLVQDRRDSRNFEPEGDGA